MKYILFGLLLFLIAWICIPMPMGKGDDERIARYSGYLTTKSGSEIRNKVGSAYVEIPLPDGIVRCIADDSHSSMWGGNVVVLCPDGNIKAWKRHVCGNGNLHADLSMYEHKCKESKAEMSWRGFVNYLDEKK
jgi:hypothetical protein